MYIGDGSTPDNAQILTRELDTLRNKIKIQYFHWPEKNDFQTIRDLLGSATEEYAVYSGDDDVHFGQTLTEAVHFLASNPDYSYARGEAFGFKIIDDQVFGAIEGTFPYSQIPNEHGTAVERLEKFFEQYNVNLFSVQRTKDLRTAFAYMKDTAVHRSMTEILPCALAVVRGKGRVLSGRPGFLRQVMERKYHMPTTFDMICDARWPESARAFLTHVADELVRVDGISAEDARREARRGIGRYVAASVTKEFQAKNPSKASSPPGIVKRVLRRLGRSNASPSLENSNEVQRMYDFLRTGELKSAAKEA